MDTLKTTPSASDPASLNTGSLEDNVSPGPARRILQSFLLVWLDTNFDSDNKDFKKSLQHLRRTGASIKTYTDVQECTDFLSEMKGEKIFMIVSGSVGQKVIPGIERLPQLESVYVFCGNQQFHEKWARKVPKIKGVHTKIETICDALQIDRENYRRETIGISFNGIDPLFMYTQLLKETILEIEDDDKQSIKELAEYCHHQGNIDQEQIEQIEREYHDHTPIWWYTAPYFIFSVLNRGLREMDIDIILKMNFFIRHLHNQIIELHDKQQVSSNTIAPFSVYRGQGLSLENFIKMQRNDKGGLMSFNNFLSTSLNPEISLDFALTPALQKDFGMVGILFIMTIDPRLCTKSSTSYADVQALSFFKEKESEILFTTHTIFRIDCIKKIPDTRTDRLWEVHLTLVGKENNEMNRLTEHLSKELAGTTGWSRFADILRRLCESGKAEQLYSILLEKANTNEQRVEYLSQLGRLYDEMNEYSKALASYQRSVEILKKIDSLAPNGLAGTYNNMGEVYRRMGENSKALSYYELSLGIRRVYLPPNHPDFSYTYNNLGLVYAALGEYSKALSYYEKDLEITQNVLPPNHPDLAVSHHNIGEVYLNMEEYSKALASHAQALEIRKIALPPNHRHLASSYNNIGNVYVEMQDYSMAVLSYERALEILKIALSPDHPDLAISYNNMGVVYMKMSEISKALSSFESAYEIEKKTLPPDHPRLTRNGKIIYHLQQALM